MLPSSSPESVGMSSERLQRAFGILQGWLNDGVVSAVASIVARRGRIAGEFYGGRVSPPQLLRRGAVRDELRIDAGLAYPPRDQLRVLPAEIEHEHGTLLGERVQLQPARQTRLLAVVTANCGGNSARPS